MNLHQHCTFKSKLSFGKETILVFSLISIFSTFKVKKQNNSDNEVYFIT